VPHAATERQQFSKRILGGPKPCTEKERVKALSESL
jgi:hypothetical protein